MRAWLIAACLSAPVVISADKIPDAGTADAPSHDKSVKAGRELFQKKKYAAALAQFKAALEEQPANRDTRFLCGLAAYWSRKPELALEYWNVLYDTAARNSADEWELARNRVMALSVISPEAAATCVDRLYELHHNPKIKAAATARGFVREHIFDKGVRAGAWEVFDERGEVQELWSFPVVNTEAEGEPLVKLITVRAALMPGGTAGFALTEEVRGFERVYKRWAQKPAYDEVRPLALQIVQGTAKPLDEKPADNADSFPDTAKPEAKPPEGDGVVSRGMDPHVASLKLTPEAARIANIAARMREVELDVTRLTKLSLTDPDLAERLMRELNAKAPRAQEDAAELVDLITRAKKEHATEAYSAIGKLGARKAFCDFALLTAINTRGADAPAEMLLEISKSKDLVVRQTALVIVARQGKRDALESLLKEVEKCDATEGNILQASLQELLGASIPTPPPPGDKDEAALKKWRAGVDEWWKAHGEKLEFVADPKPDQPFWK